MSMGCSKSYGDIEVVRGIDLAVQRGEVFAFLGPNGAGKTTTVEILEGYRERSAGDVTVLDSDPQHAGERLARPDRPGAAVHDDARRALGPGDRRSLRELLPGTRARPMRRSNSWGWPRSAMPERIPCRAARSAAWRSRWR